MQTCFISSLFSRPRRIAAGSLWTPVICQRAGSSINWYRPAAGLIRPRSRWDCFNEPFRITPGLCNSFLGNVKVGNSINYSFQKKLKIYNQYAFLTTVARLRPVHSLPSEYYDTFRQYGAEVTFFGHYEDEEDEPSQWKATGVRAILTKRFLTHGAKSVGERAYTTPFYPPGWSSLESPTRGHLLARQLGGDGRYWLNIVSLNRNINCIDMNRVEQKVANVLKTANKLPEHCAVLYIVKVVYKPAVDYPHAIYIYTAIVNDKRAAYFPWFLYKLTQDRTEEIFKNKIPNTNKYDCPQTTD